MRIRATLHCMAESEIRSMIPADKLKEIKAKCAKPVFRAYVVGHEGEARGNLVGVGNIVKKWFSDMVQKLNEKIGIGLQLFHGHAETNDTEGRVPIGEVVAKKIMTIKDKLSSVMIGWIFPDYCNLPLDVASIEADVDLEGSIKGGNLFVSDVNDITGIALGNSEIETPGFPGATLLGQLQAFAEKQSLKITLFEGENTMTLAELKQAIQESKLQPSDVFSQDVLFADPAIKEQVQEKVKSVTGYNIRKLEELTEEKVTLTKKLEEANAKIEEGEKEKKKLVLESSKTKVGTLFEAQKTARKLDEKQVKYIQKKLDDFSPEKPEELEKEFNTYLDKKIDEYSEIAKDVFGIEDKDNGKDKGKTGGTEPNEGGSEDTGDENKYTDPTQNPLIKTD